MVATDPSQIVGHDGRSLGYEYSWLHRHCTSQLIHHKRARGSGRLFSGLMAMNVIFLGAAFISSVTLSSMPAQNANIFLAVLMFCSSGWIIFYLLSTRKKQLSVITQDHHAGAIWLKASLALFGICSVLLAFFKIGYDVTQMTCKLPMDIILSVMEIIFISTQTCLLWISCQDCVQVHHDITRYGIMLSLSTNLLLWLTAVITDSVHREMESLQANSTSNEESGCLCLQESLCWSFQRGYVTLYPFNLEYSLVCASMLYIMWRNVGRKDVSSSIDPHPKFHLQGVLYGPVLGGAALLVGFCVFIQYQIQASSGIAALMSFILYYFYNVILLPLMIISCIAGIIAQTFKEKQLGEESEEQSGDEESNNDAERTTKQENKESDHDEKTSNTDRTSSQNNWCRHRYMERTKDNEQRDKEQKEDQEWPDQEYNCEKCKSIPIKQLVDKERMDHLETSHHYRTRRKINVEKTSHDIETHSCKTPKNYTRSLEITLLLAAALGHICISYYSIVAILAAHTYNQLNTLNLTYSVLMILEHIFQNIFIIEGMRKDHHGHIHPTSQEESIEEAPRRMSLLEIRRVSLAYLQSVRRLNISQRLVKEVALFLVLCNIMLWVMSAFGAHPQYTNGLEREFYGPSAWFSILNFGLPLTVFYRMHSVGGLLEVYLTA